MNQNFNKEKVKYNFNLSNKSYNHNAVLQKMVARDLVFMAREEILLAEKILDLGCGTGFVVDGLFGLGDVNIAKEIFQLDIAYQMLLENQFSTNKINADIDFLPFKKNSFDLALSSLSLQWVNDLQNSIKQAVLSVKKGGNFYFSLIADGSLIELKQACQSCDVPLSINNFISQNQLEEILSELGFSYQIQSKNIVLEYQNLVALLKSIKNIGAGYSNNKGYLGKNGLDKISNFYLNKFNQNNKVLATWQVLCVFVSNEK